MGPKRSCHRTRNVCCYCQQNLGYTAFRRHRDLPHLYCPGFATSSVHVSNSSDSESSESYSTFSFSEQSSKSSSIDGTEHSNTFSPLSSSSDSKAATDSESGPEVWESCSDDESEGTEQQPTPNDKNLHYIICLFLTFFNFAIMFQTKQFRTYCYSYRPSCIMPVHIARIPHCWLHYSAVLQVLFIH